MLLQEEQYIIHWLTQYASPRSNWVILRISVRVSFKTSLTYSASSGSRLRMILVLLLLRDLSNKYIVLDISELKGKLLPVGMMIALDYVWDQVKADRTKRKMVFIDEIWKLIGGAANKRDAKLGIGLDQRLVQHLLLLVVHVGNQQREENHQLLYLSGDDNGILLGLNRHNNSLCIVDPFTSPPSPALINADIQPPRTI